MRAVTFGSFGGPEVLVVSEIGLPEPGEGQVRVRVLATPVQPADLAARSGAFGPMLPAGVRYTPGWDMAGVIDALGPGVTGFAVGAPVVGLSDWLATKAGTHATHVVLSAGALAPAPAGMEPQLASTLPANAQTAAQALELLGLRSGQTLAITGAGGAVGGYAAELARLQGLEVIALASLQDEAFLTARGVRFVPRADNPAEALRAVAPGGVDGLLDGAVLGGAVMSAVADGGAFLSLMPPTAPLPERGVRVHVMSVHSDGRQLRTLVELAEHGRLTPRVAAVFPFEQAAEAHWTAAKGGLRGRVVLVP